MSATFRVDLFRGAGLVRVACDDTDLVEARDPELLAAVTAARDDARAAVARAVEQARGQFLVDDPAAKQLVRLRELQADAVRRAGQSAATADDAEARYAAALADPGADPFPLHERANKARRHANELRQHAEELAEDVTRAEAALAPRAGAAARWRELNDRHHAGGRQLQAEIVEALLAFATRLSAAEGTAEGLRSSYVHEAARSPQLPSAGPEPVPAGGFAELPAWHPAQ